MVSTCKFVTFFPIGILGQVLYMVVSIPDLCALTYFDVSLSTKRTNKTFYFEEIRNLKQRCAKCIALKGDHIEK